MSCMFDLAPPQVNFMKMTKTQDVLTISLVNDIASYTRKFTLHEIHSFDQSAWFEETTDFVRLLQIVIEPVAYSS